MPYPENCSLYDLGVARRMMALRALLIGIPRDQVVKLFSVTERTILNWIVSFNQKGIDGLIEAKSPGAPPIITHDQNPIYKDLIDNPDKANQVHWTARKFHGYLKAKFKLEISYRSVVRWLHKEKYALKVPRPWSDLQDEEQRQNYLDKLKTLLENPKVDIWYLDETGVEADPRPKRRWAQKGKELKVTKNGGHVRMNVTGMVCPRTGSFYALEISHCRTLL